MRGGQMPNRINYTNPIDLERVSVHEAAHGVVCTLSPLLPPVRMVELNVSDAWILTGGTCHSEEVDKPGADPLMQARLRQKLAVVVAGALGEMLAFGSSRSDWLSDAEGKIGDMSNLNAIMELLEGDRDAHLQAAYARATELLTENWHAVEYVAVKLLEVARMPGDLLRVLMSTAPGRGKLPPVLAARLAKERAEMLAGLEGI
jgi:hypothetical protein